MPNRVPNSRVVLTGAIAAVVSGVPSTVFAVLSGNDVLAATRAAGTLLPGRRTRPAVLPGIAVHVAVSAWWIAVLARVSRRHRLGLLGGTAAGALIAALDLEILGRRYPAIQALPRLPQWLDHLVFGALVGALLPKPAEDGSLVLGLTHPMWRWVR